MQTNVILHNSLYTQWNYIILQKCIEFIGCTDLFVEKYKANKEGDLSPQEPSLLKVITDEAVTSGNLNCFRQDIIGSEAFEKYMTNITGISVEYWRGVKCLNLGARCTNPSVIDNSPNKLPIPIKRPVDFQDFLSNPFNIDLNSKSFLNMHSTAKADESDDLAELYSLNGLLKIMVINQKKDMKADGVRIKNDISTNRIGAWNDFIKSESYDNRTHEYLPRYISMDKNSMVKTLISNLLVYRIQREDATIRLD